MVFLICAGFYLSIPAIVFLMRSDPSDPFKESWAPGTVTSVGAFCMRARARHTLSFVPHSGPVCEIGPGRGILAVEAQKAGLEYWAIDMDAAALQTIPAEKTFLCRVPPLPDMPEAPALIVAESVLEHLKDYQEVLQVLSECYEKLAKGGVIVIRVPEIRYMRWRFWDSAPDHSYVTSKRRVATLLRASGFSIIAHGYYLDQFTGVVAKTVYWVKSLWPWELLHEIFYKPWQESAFSKIAEKTPACYIVAKKGHL